MNKFNGNINFNNKMDGILSNSGDCCALGLEFDSRVGP